MEGIPFQEVGNLMFTVCSPEEVKKLSVMEITNPLAFDMLEHPVSDGLYDPHLGPNNHDELCETCSLKLMHCPGHNGHIALPLPVFHPVFIKTLYQLLQGTCFKCHQMVAPKNATQVAFYQFQALDYGLVGTVKQMAEAVSDPSIISTDKTVETSFFLQEKLKSILEKAVDGAEMKTLQSQVKSVVECRQRIVKEFLRTNFTNARKKCPHCGAKKPIISLRHNSQFISHVEKRDATRRLAKTVVKAEDRGIESIDMSENLLPDDDDDDEESSGNISITPADAKKHLNIVWEKEKMFLQRIFGILRTKGHICEQPINIFFVELLIVPPSRFRPISVVKGRKYLNPKSAALKNVLTTSLLMKNLIKFRNGDDLPDADKDQLLKLPGKNDQDKFANLWQQLQLHVNCVYDSEANKLDKDKTFAGVKQILEKKEGLFRKNMMGKRVNFAARSVISPDPNIMVDEVGVPVVFAKKLTYPTPVADWNFEKLRRAVINGPNVHPGADKVEMGDGRIIKLSATDPLQRQALACQLLTPLSSAKGVYKGIPKKVHRHLVNGDMLLLNRQPTLHKPSIMAHKARVLPGEKTLRLHYANCKSYNADFDGDEMNAHFPQDDVSRSEGINIAGVNHQYLVPKDGTPLSGLIQDHIIAGTLLTVRGSFFNKVEYQQLVYGAIAFKGKTVTYLPPTMLKPQQLWSGKQVVSTIIINIIPEGKPPPTIEGKTKVDEKSWQNELARLWTAGGPLHDDMCESEVIIRSGELLCGIIDKAHIGPTPYSLVHCCYELYGGETSSALLTALARLFTLFLQMQKGFTLSYEDILLTDEASKNRHETIRNARKVGDKVVAKAFDVDDPNNKSQIIGKFREAHLARDDIGLKTLDFEMKNATNSFNDEINKFCNRWGLLKKFPSNNLQLMVLSGAKGGLVNSTQISGALGQIELEGRRVPLMQTGKTLPSFLSYDTSPRAGGFVDECFLSGVHIQEYFFHCMAGREGLIDTAVKTSRSGYLQRCLIKHLEGLVVNYDMTVRDSDGSVIQFLYGEDGLDVSKMQMLKEGKLHLLAENYASVVDEDQIEILKADTEHSLMPDPLTSKNDLHENLGIQNSQLSHSELSNMSTLYQHKVYSFLHSKKNRSCPDFQETSLTPARSDPLNSKFRADLTFGTVSEKLDNLIQDYVFNNYLNVQGKKKRKKRAAATRALDMYYYRAMKALVQPGEAVGLLAAQSIGEPSTQMTLNTFHFAGRGEMNVTLGIPRLREILMIASASIATPTMDLPLLKLPNVEKKADKLRIKLSSVSLNQVMQGINISEIKHVKSKYHRFRKYVVRMTFCPHSVYKKKLHTSPSEILQYIENTFIHKIITVIKKKLTILSKANSLTTSRKDKGPTISNSETDDFQPTVVDLDEGETSDEGANDDDTAASKARNRHNQELEYEEPESDENPDDPDSDEPMNDESSILKTEFDSGLETNDNEDMEDILKILKNEMHKNNSSSKVQQTGYKQKKARIESIKQKYQWVQDYDYDYEEQLWCQFTLQLCLEGSKVDIKTLLEDEAASAILYSVSGIKQAFLIKNPDSKVGGQMLKTDGVNFLEIFKHVNIIDTSKVYSNDIHAIAKIYGIEAAARVLVKEIKNVFATYHITVDPRHLLLIADYMTYDGTFKACNRIGMESNASPIQQMTFETTMNFLQTAALSGSEDLLKSPSARLVVGQSVRVGTGSFDLLIKPDDVMQEKLN